MTLLAWYASHLHELRTRQLTLQHKEWELLKDAAPCSLCGALIGSHCIKPSGQKRSPHAERRRAAKSAGVDT